MRYRHYVAHIEEDDRLSTICGISPPPDLPEGREGDTVDLCTDCHDVYRGVLRKSPGTS